MLARLLLAVLTVAGPVPVRVCTCAAVAGESPEVAPRVAEPQPVKGCGCKHHRAETASAADAARPEAYPLSDSHRPNDPDHHARGCPATSPRPVMLEAGPAADAPAADAAVALLPVVGFSTGRLAAVAPARLSSRPAIPLYLSLLVIRV